MKKSTRIHPVVESLESMMLLSTAVGELHALKTVHVAPVAAVTLNLQGTLHGTGKIAGTSAAVSGSGNLGHVGTVSFKTTINLSNPPSSITLATNKGNLYLQASSALVSSGSNSGSTTYTIVGGTKTYALANGSGSIAATYTLAKSKLSLTIHFA